MSKRQSLQSERLSGRYFLESLHIGALDSNGVEHKFLLSFAVVNRPCGAVPSVRWAAIGNQKNPGTVIRNAVCFVNIFARAQQLEAVCYGLTHRRIAARLKVDSPKLRGGSKITLYLYRTKGDDRHFDAFGSQRVGLQLLRKRQIGR